ncbi:MAG: helix-turn-helix domain-containing protein [Enterobacterales bacterium]|nr:helix-turn-helix domain-containing protein [Enterobacterales bacterium]
MSKRSLEKILYYRLNVFPIKCLSLAERPKDILPLANMFLAKYCAANAKSIKQFSPQAEAKLVAYAWPGNVRELDNFIQRLAVLSDQEMIETADVYFGEEQLVNEITGKNEIQTDIAAEDSLLGSDMRHHEYQLIIESLSKCKGKKKAVAEQLGISARTLRYKLAKMREAGYQIPQKRSMV